MVVLCAVQLLGPLLEKGRITNLEMYSATQSRQRVQKKSCLLNTSLASSPERTSSIFLELELELDVWSFHPCDQCPLMATLCTAWHVPFLAIRPNQ